MDNLHTLIVICLLAFGLGHALFTTHIRFWGFLLLVIILSPILFDVYDSKHYPVIITSFVAGLAFAHREWIIDIFTDIADVGCNISDFFSQQRNKPNNKRNNQSDFHNEFHQRTEQAKQQEWQAEQQRREQEVTNQRGRERQKKEQQQQKEKPTSQSRRSHNKAKSNNPRQNNTKQKSNNKTQQQSTYQEKPPQKTAPPTDNRSPLEILGLQAGFTQQELKKAYRRESARCHPDKWAGKPEHIQKAMGQEQKLVNWAYKTLS